jgi:uncharacterized protein (DUF1697 family)
VVQMGNKLQKYVILLRGVMPTGKNKVPMAILRAALEETGLIDVRTYIQNGNVVASYGAGVRQLEVLVHDTIKDKIGADITIIARAAEEFGKILGKNPFSDFDPSRIYFSIMESTPDKTLLKAFLTADYSPDQIKVVDDTIYTLYATKLSDSKFINNYFESKLKIRATTRNINTMNKLMELSSVKISLK